LFASEVRSSRWVKGVLQVLSLGAYLGLFLFLVDGAAQFSSLLGEDIEIPFVFVSGFCGIICCGLVSIVRSALSVTVLNCLGLKAGALAFSGYLLCLVASNMQLPVILCAAFSAAFGYGFGMLGIGRCLVLSDLKSYRAVRYMALAGLIASTLRALLLVLPFLPLSVLVGLLILLSSVMPLRIEPRKRSEIAPNTTETARMMFSHNWVFLAGLFLSTAIGTTVWRDAIAGSTVYQAGRLFGQLGVSLGMLVASAVLLWLYGRKLLDKLKVLTPVVPIAGIALSLLNWFIGVWQEGPSIFGGYSSSTGSFLGNILTGFSIMIIIIVFIAHLLKTPTRSLSPILTFGILSILCAAFFLLYTSLQITLTLESSRTIDLLLKAIYLVVAVFYLANLAFSKKQGADSLTGRKLDKTVARFSLSKREAEVLQLLTQGHSVPYISETLFISLNTIRTHIKRIYAKVGVHTREELLDVVYGTDDD
jgi:DNA-binding CsgD family transcriptional regulator